MTQPDRLETLETKCAYLEAAVQELSDVVYRQQQAIDRLLVGQQELVRRLGEVAPAAASPADVDERPPHY
jgi:SlyX protein